MSGLSESDIRRLLKLLRPVFADTARETVSRLMGESEFVIPRAATVVSGVDDDGEVAVHIDGDPQTDTVNVVATGQALTQGQRVLTLASSANMFAIGELGGASTGGDGGNPVLPVWQIYAPTIAVDTDFGAGIPPTVGGDGLAIGSYIEFGVPGTRGNLVIEKFSFKFDPASGANQGTAPTWKISHAVPLQIPDTDNGFSSDEMGWGLVTPNGPGLRLTGQHQAVTYHSKDTGYCGAVLAANAKYNGTWRRSFTTTNSGAITQTNPNYGSLLTLTESAVMNQVRWKLEGTALVGASAANTAGQLVIAEGATILKTEPFYFKDAFNALTGVGGYKLHVTHWVESPTVGDHTYTLGISSPLGATFSANPSNLSQFATELILSEGPSAWTADNVGAGRPFDFDRLTTFPELWGIVIGVRA